MEKGSTYLLTTRNCLSLYLFTIMMALGGCTGRDAQHVPIVTASDTTMTCEKIAEEIKITNQQLQEHARQVNLTNKKNSDTIFLAGALPPFGIFGLLGLDMKRAARSEMHAYGARNQALGRLATVKSCQTPPVKTAEDAMRGSVQGYDATWNVPRAPPAGMKDGAIPTAKPPLLGLDYRRDLMRKFVRGDMSEEEYKIRTDSSKLE